MSRSVKRLINLLITLLLCAGIVFTIISMLANSKRDLTQLDSYEGKVISKGIAENPATNINVTKVFYIKLDGLDQTLSTYNLKQDYAQLDSAFQIGDQVKVYYQRSSFPEVANLHTYQFEKKGKIIIGEGEIENKELKGGILSAVVVILILAFGYLRDRKIRRSTSIEGK